MSAHDDLSFESFVANEATSSDLQVIQKSQLTFLKSKVSHKLRILPGVPPDPPRRWFVRVVRHYIGSEALQPVLSSSAMKGSLCPNSIGDSQNDTEGPSACFVCDAIRYLDALGDPLSREIYTSEAIIVNAYTAGQIDPEVTPVLLPKSVASQLGSLWREGTIFFHPTEGCSLLFRPIEGTNMFSVMPDLRDTHSREVPQSVLEQATCLSDVVRGLIIPYQRMKAWFRPPFVACVMEFLSKGKIVDYRKMSTPSTAPNLEDDIIIPDDEADGGEQEGVPEGTDLAPFAADLQRLINE